MKTLTTSEFSKTYPPSNMGFALKVTLLLYVLSLLEAPSILAQEFRSLPPTEQPNATELAYFNGTNPTVLKVNASDSAAVRLVVSFLEAIINEQFEAAYAQLTDDFRAYAPGYQDFIEIDDLTAQWERNRRLFINQQLQIEEARTTTVASGERYGQWVFVKATWSAQSSQQPGTPIRIPFFELVQLRAGKIQRTYISYGNDQIFQDLGFPLYANGPSLQPARTGHPR